MANRLSLLSPDGKLNPYDWSRMVGDSFIKKVAQKLNVPKADIYKTTRGRNGGTWAHWQIGAAYANQPRDPSSAYLGDLSLLLALPCPQSTDYGHMQNPCPKYSLTVFRTYNNIRTTFSYTIKEFNLSRVFAYCRVSTSDQTTDNQVQEIAAAGFTVTPQRTIAETISGSVASTERKGFKQLLNKLEAGDVLVVTKIDRLGRNAMDVRATVDSLAAVGVRVHCLALGGVDLTSAAGKMTMTVLGAVAEFERDLLIERTQAGLARARAEGKTLGRKPALAEDQAQEVRQRLAAGESVAALAKKFDTSRQTIMRVRNSEVA